MLEHSRALDKELLPSCPKTIEEKLEEELPTDTEYDMLEYDAI